MYENVFNIAPQVRKPQYLPRLCYHYLTLAAISRAVCSALLSAAKERCGTARPIGYNGFQSAVLLLRQNKRGQKAVAA